MIAIKTWGLEAGFDRVFVSPLFACERWARESQIEPSPRWADIEPDPRALLPGATRLVFLQKSYSLYRKIPGEAYVSPYYVCSNEAFVAARSLARRIADTGAQALHTERFPLKAASALLGLGVYGRNCVLASEGMGTRLTLQMILTDAELPLDALPAASRPDPACHACARCVSACPVGALGGDRLDLNKCLRALPAAEPIPEALRPLLGGSLLGCDICQEACPRNADVPMIDTPPDVRAATDLPRLLSGDMRALSQIVGANYARKKRTLARALIAAANLKRRDCLPLIEALTGDDYPAVREHARWAAVRLSSF